ncbi:MAG: hypothetical protein LBP71_00680 [Spirochaetaceae bacterium]|jgi:hypothetical protein|nr:hypothetical protein [Spirochaetaceae bacterium]
MKRRMPFGFFVVLIFLMVLVPVVLILINLSGMITWVSRKASFFGGNALLLVVLIPIVCGLLLFLGVIIITKKEEKITLAAHERMKKSPPGFSWEKELRNISTLIDAVGGSLDHIQNASKDILSMSEKINQQFRPQGERTVSPPDDDSGLKKLPPPSSPPVWVNKLPEIPRTAGAFKTTGPSQNFSFGKPADLEGESGPFAVFSKAFPEADRVLGKTLAAGKINQTMEYRIFKTGIPEKAVLHMLFAQLKIEQGFHFSP